MGGSPVRGIHPRRGVLPVTDPDPYRDTPVAINELLRNLARLQQLAPAALIALHAEANQHDSHRTVASGVPTQPGTGDNTRVETAALNRLEQNGPTTAAWSIYDYVITARDATRHAIRDCINNINRTTPNPPYLTATEKRRLYCIEPDCHNIGDREGRCEQHHIEHDKAHRARRALNERIRYHSRKNSR